MEIQTTIIRQTKSSTKPWLFESHPPIADTESGLFCFRKCKPPTTKEVYLNFVTQHNALQIKSKRQSKTRNAALLTAQELIKWWRATDIPTKTDHNIASLIIKVHNEYESLKKSGCGQLQTYFTVREAFLARKQPEMHMKKRLV